MSELGNKIHDIFGSVAVYKNPRDYDVFVGRNLPSFIKDYLISSHLDENGQLRREALSNYLNAHIPNDNNEIKGRLLRGEILNLLTRINVATNIAAGKVEFQIVDMGIKFKDTEIPDTLVRKYPQDLSDGEKWGLIQLVYLPPDEGSRGLIQMANFKPFRPMEHIDINMYRECRQHFSTEEWIDVLVTAMEYNPASFSDHKQKFEFVTRLLPFVEPNLNMIELAPKGTGKSFVFGQLSKYVWLLGGGLTSRAKIFYNKSTQQPGLLYSHDCVAFDELQSLKFTDGKDIQALLKGYLEYGKTNVDNYEFMSNSGVMLLGNLDTLHGFPKNEDYFLDVPEIFKETALMERFHGFIEGWFLPRINDSMILRDWTLNVEFFSEILHQLRTESIYGGIVGQLVGTDADADTRHTKAVKRIATAYSKLLYPHITSVSDVDKEEFDKYCLQPAVHRRDIIRWQCSIRDTEYLKPMSPYWVK